MKKEDQQTVLGLVASIVAVALLIMGWGEDEANFPVFTFLGITVIAIALVYVALSKRLRTRPWKDLPF